ncbi:molecular chaperone DnaJ [Candidatus Absconditicoccus praedator]|uniref:molecular chaperone DnaJ n=1 Tax=Candidatus Absconditicoccus praedator TaxID=2735562 RepID=UPI001E448824|nr:molecular chaperone DnaJ [Candidatus Absconditicoccus praedator]UFX82566.1 molecular chaperone DnaJ [Candidatus Absconditicoccus praedator]
MFDFDPNKNYYEILGVDENASEDEIKKAFRKLAVKHHPDRGGDQEEFKKINEAYQILSDNQKRQQYDQVRKGGMGGMGGGFGGGGMGGTTFDVEDIFGDVFGDIFGGGGFSRGRGASKRPRRGEDIVVSLEVDFKEAYKGVSKEFKYKRNVHCDVCDGTGVDKESQKTTCSTCGGRGAVIQTQKTPFGVMQSQTVCPDCRGEGSKDSKPCTNCGGRSLTSKEEKIKVDIPSGIRSGEHLKVPGMGNYGINQGPAGDLYVKVNIKGGSGFKREGDNLVVEVEVPYYDAVLGGEVEVDHPDGKTTVKIPKGTQPGERISVSGKGFGQGGFGIWNKKGDMIVVPKIKLPKKLTKEQQDLFKKLKEIG